MGLIVRGQIPVIGRLQGAFPQTPVASFSASPVFATTSTLTVQFTDTSTGRPAAWLWDFKNDGTATSTQQNPTYTYDTPGTYSVKLTATNSAGASNTATLVNLISFGPAPAISFTATPTNGLVPLTVQFTDTSTNNPTSWLWDFKNDGTATSTQKNPIYTYTSTGTYSVSLSATNIYGTTTGTQVAYINVTDLIPQDASGTSTATIGLIMAVYDVNSVIGTAVDIIPLTAVNDNTSAQTINAEIIGNIPLTMTNYSA